MKVTMDWDANCEHASEEVRSVLESCVGLDGRRALTRVVNWLAEWTDERVEEREANPDEERKTVAPGQLDCLDLHIVNAWFALDWIRGGYELEDDEEKLVDEALATLQSLIPWMRFQS